MATTEAKRSTRKATGKGARATNGPAKGSVAAKKARAGKGVGKKTGAKAAVPKATSKKATARKATKKRAVAKKAAAKKAPTKKGAVKKTAPKKAAAKKATTKKAPTRKATAEKPATKKSTSRRTSGGKSAAQRDAARAAEARSAEAAARAAWTPYPKKKRKMGPDGVIVLSGEKQVLRLYYGGQQIPSPMGGFLMSLGVHPRPDGTAGILFECSASSLRYRLEIPAATRTERSKVKKVQKEGGDPDCPRHGPGTRLIRAGTELVCPLCGIGFGKA